MSEMIKEPKFKVFEFTEIITNEMIEYINYVIDELYPYYAINYFSNEPPEHRFKRKYFSVTPLKITIENKTFKRLGDMTFIYSILEYMNKEFETSVDIEK